MADGLNKAMLIGNLGTDPELRSTASGRSVLKFPMATTESYKDASGTLQKVTHWHNIVLWGPRAEGLSRIMSKGMRVYVEGRIETRSYEDANKVKKYTTDIVATNLILLDGRKGEGAPGGVGGPPRGAGGAPHGGGGGGGHDFDDVPPDDLGGGSGGAGGGGGHGSNDDDIPF